MTKYMATYEPEASCRTTLTATCWAQDFCCPACQCDQLSARKCDRQKQLSGRIEIEDAYLHGERNSIKVGRDAEGKASFIAAVQTAERGHPLYARLDSVASIAKPELQASGNRFMPNESIAISFAGSNCFAAPASVIDRHGSIAVGFGEPGIQQPSFRWVNTVIISRKSDLSGPSLASDQAGRRWCASELRIEG